MNDIDVREAKREAAFAVSAHFHGVSVQAENLILLSYSRIQSDWIMTFKYPDHPDIEIAVQKRGIQIKTQIWKLLTQETHPIDRPQRPGAVKGIIQ